MSKQTTAERILFLSWGVPPQVSGASTVVANLAKQFSPDEMIVAGEEPHERAPFTWNDRWPRIVYLLKAWPTGRRGGRLRRKLLFPLLLIRCLRLARKYNCRHVLVIYPKQEYLLAAYLTARWTGARLFPYLHNTYTENYTGLSALFARWLQRRVFSEAAHVFVMSDGMVEFYRERYPQLQCSALVHSFSEPIPDALPAPEAQTALRCIISGHIWDSCLDATTRVCEAISQLKGASLTFLSGMPRVFLEEMGLLRNGFAHETVPHGQVVSRLSASDIVILPHGFDGALPKEEYHTMFPTRTIEYLLCGRPILAHTPPDCFLTRFLKEHQCALVVDKPSVADLLNAISRLQSDPELRAHLVQKALSVAKMFHAPGVAATLRARLESC